MIPKLKTQSSFLPLCEYVFKEDARRICGNMVSRNPQKLAEEFEVIRRVRKEIRSPAWHVILSAPKGESLEDKEWKSVFSYFLEGMGLDTTNHQYFAMKHLDTEHQHVHSVINRIGFDGVVFHNRNDYWKSIQVCRAVEREFGLKKTMRKVRDKLRDREIER